MKQIIVDTNFLMIPFQFKIDVFPEIEKMVMEPYEIFILEKTISELNKIIKEQKGKNKIFAKLALDYVNLYSSKLKINILKSESDKYVDDLIVDLSDINTIVCTLDGDLKRRVKEKNSKVIEMRQKNHLVLS